MKKRIAVLVTAVFCLTIFTQAAQAAQEFASIDIIDIVNRYDKAQELNKKIEKKAKEMESALQKELDNYKKAEDRFQLLSEKKKEAEKPKLEKQFKELQESEREKQLDLRKANFDNNKLVAEDINDAVEGYAKKEGLTLIFDSRALVYKNKSVDITGKIVDILNKKK